MTGKTHLSSLFRNSSELRKRVACAGLVVVMSLATYLGHQAAICWDMAWYTVRGLNILLGRGYVGSDLGTVHIERGPLFPAMLAAAMWIDQTQEAAFWIVRFFALITPLLLFFLGTQMSGPTVGTVAAVAYMTTLGISFASMRHLDAVWPAFVLLAFIASIAAQRRHSIFLAVLSGICLGIGYLTKEAALVFFVVPFAAWFLLPDFRNRRGFKLALTATLGTLVSIAPWLAYVYVRTGTLHLTGAQGANVLEALSFNGEEAAGVSLTGKFVHAAAMTVKEAFLNVFPLGILVLCGALAPFVLMVRANRMLRLVALGVLLTAPIVIYTATREWRVGYYIPFYQFSFLGLAAMVGFLTDSISVRLRLPALSWALPAAFLVTWILTQAVVPNATGKTNAHFLSGSLVASSMEIKAATLQGDHFDRKKYAPVLAAIEQGESSVQAVMVDSPPATNALYFLLNGRIRTISMPWVFCLTDCRAAESCTLPVRSTAPPLYFKLGKGNSIFLFAEHLMEVVENSGVTHVVTTGYYGPQMNDYLGRHPAFRRIALDGPAGRRLGLWSVDKSNLSAMQYPVFVDPKTIETVSALRRNEPRRYDAMIAGMESCLGPGFGRNYFESWFPFAQSKGEARSDR